MAKNTTTEFNQIALELTNDIVSFSPEAFDNLVIQKGVTFNHYSAIPCSGGEFDTGDVRSGHDGHDCFNGKVYRLEGKISGVFSNVMKNDIFNSPGVVDHAYANLIVPRFYDNGKRAYFAPYDRLAIICSDERDAMVPFWERISISQTGVDKLSFPVHKVLHLIDSFQNDYNEGVDFIVKNGNIVWIGQHRPTYDEINNEGQAYSIRYLTNCGWIVNNVIHELRVLKTTNPNTGENETTRYPMYLQLVREIVFWGQKKSRIINSLDAHFV